uniref:Uncharacterized protein n=1 Tax=Rhizophora mucronata TaxID=61149 RepID=A0A2P2M0F3_RHIMU
MNSCHTSIFFIPFTEVKLFMVLAMFILDF